MTGLLLALTATLLLTTAAVWFGSHAEPEGCSFPLVVGGVTFLFAGILSGMVGLSYDRAHYNERHVECTVTNKDRGGDDGSYRIYTEQCGVLANTDSLWHAKWDSADVWQGIEPGQTYRFHVVGWRFGFFSHFPNVLDVEDAAPAPAA
ncbi:hypothetical protein CDO52_00905 [Nocardiopsis gilva YIM 90087]|uniref:Uncharacterized protein n=1 Tax=Nocardiopsis gilva YIM 90087 TaxID=1235441 RepID=A0A223S0A7_9ACTN|nr:hypothetical protein [Nocardiopsis gilva]ASU81538.1 hypothetical protein CDO52_00905 [Nocardiopsis gilva YIM 90087]